MLSADSCARTLHEHRTANRRYTSSRAGSYAFGAAKTHQPQREDPMVNLNYFPTFLSSSIQTTSRAFSFDRRASLAGIADILDDPSIRQIDVLKATQIGMTTLIRFGYSLWEMSSHGHNVGYFLPTNKMAQETLRERLAISLSGQIAQGFEISPSEGIA